MSANVVTGQPRFIGDRAQLLQFLLAVASESIWLTAWSLVVGVWLVSGAGAPLLPAWAVIGLVSGSAVTSRLLDARRTTHGWRLGLALLGLLFAAVAGLNAASGDGGIDWAEPWRWVATGDLAFRPAATMGLTLLAWWRGLVLGQSLLSLDEVEGAFRRGVGAMIVLALLNAVTPANVRAPASMLIWPTIGVVATGLLGLPLARLVDLRASVTRAGGPALRLDRQWLGMLLATVVLLIGGALVVASIVSFERLDTLFAWLRGPLELLLEIILTIFLMPIAYLLDALVTFLRQFIQPGQPMQQDSGAGERNTQPIGLTVPPDLEWILVLLRVLLALGLVLGIGAFLAAAIMRFADRGQPNDVDEERDFVFSWRAARSSVRDWFMTWLRRLWPPAPTVTAATRPAAVPIERGLWGPRELYRAMVRLGAVAGRPRSMVETPHEYAGALIGYEPLAPSQPAITALTALYARDRYGDEPIAPSEIAAGHTALADLEATVIASQATDASP